MLMTNINSVVKLERVCTKVLVCSHDPTNCLRTNYNLCILNAKNLEPRPIYIFFWYKIDYFKLYCYSDDKPVYTLQEMCCGFLLSREMWYRKSVLPGTGAG